YKLEKKAFEIAKQYALIAPGFTRDFNAAIKSFDNFVYEFPGSTLREDALFYKFDAAYKQAMNSYESAVISNVLVPLRKNRLTQAKEYYAAFKKNFGDSKYMADADKMAVTIDEELKNYNDKS